MQGSGAEEAIAELVESVRPDLRRILFSHRIPPAGPARIASLGARIAERGNGRRGAIIATANG
jgi:hypothetical protein